MDFKVFIILILSHFTFLAQTEIVVNTFTENSQIEPAIAKIDAQENIAVAWVSNNQADSNSESDIYMQMMSPDLSAIGDELLVNEITSGIQDKPQIASNKDGDFVIVWSSFDRNYPDEFFDVKGRIFNKQGAVTEEFIVNTFQNNTQTRPEVAMDLEGNFIVVWESWYQDGSERGVYAQKFNSEGIKEGTEFLVNTTTMFSQCKPTISFFNNGSFIIVWETWLESERGYNLFAKIYDKQGNIVKDEFQINSYTDNYQWYSDVTTYSDNSFDIVWCSWEQDGYDGGIYLKSYDSLSIPSSDEILINSSTKYYQWLPKIEKFEDERKVIIWSSLNLDGSMEGVYYKIYDKVNNELSLETKLNEYNESYQWQPSIISLSTNEFVGVWSSWGELDSDYEIMAKKILPNMVIGFIDSNDYQHPEGKSTSNFIVHVIDSSKLTGHQYEISFTEEEESKYLSFSVVDLETNILKVSNSPLNYGNDVKYLSNKFDGIIVEILPNFELKIDFDKSLFINNSNSNVKFNVENSSIFPAIAPIDLALIWGNTDTLSNGNYLSPLDTALSPSNVKEIIIPFEVRNLESGEKIEVLIFENNNSKNNRWDVGEEIFLLTPEYYRTSEFNTHVKISSSSTSQNLTLPSINDTIFISTKKPLATDDKYYFSTESSKIILDIDSEHIENEFKLFQNYPNPFNPSTTINYSIPKNVSSNYTHVKLNIYDILGRKIVNLVDDFQAAGDYSISFNGKDFTSGIYFYRIELGELQLTKKMLLIK